MDGQVAVAQIPLFTEYPVTIETDEEEGIHLDVLKLVHVVGTDKCVAEIPGMVGKDIGMDAVAEGTEQQDG